MNSSIQVWRCSNCGATRGYGNADYPDSTRVALLICAKGCKGQRHVSHTFIKSEPHRWDSSGLAAPVMVN